MKLEFGLRLGMEILFIMDILAFFISVIFVIAVPFILNQYAKKVLLTAEYADNKTSL